MLFIQIDKEEKRSYSRQIYRDIRNKILEGKLEERSRLPSTRDLSAELSVSRNTVLTAYDMLVAEGFVESVPGSGLYVKGGIRVDRGPLLLWDQQTGVLSGCRIPDDCISFDSGIPALDLFPRNKWNSYVSRAFRDAPVSALGYDDPQGRPELRRMLSAYLKKSRGIDCSPDQILITSGAKQGLTLVAKCLLNSSSEVLIEDPSNRNVAQIFSYHTKNILPIPVDREGIITDRLPQNMQPALLFTTPSHQFPMGGLLTIGRRLELVDYARRTGCWLIEDDYDSEFRYDGTPLTSLQEIDPGRVIYIGTFSKILYPSLRLGYMVLPPSLVPMFREWKRLSDHHSNSVYQLALMRFIEDGELERHIRHMKRVYRKRRETLLEIIQQVFQGRCRIYGEAAGMHLVLELPGIDFTPELSDQIRSLGVYTVPVEEHALEKGRHCNQIILGYSHLSPGEMEQGLRRIRDGLKL